MREIEFRGKRVDNGEWAYGYYCKATRHWHKYGIHNDWIITSAFQNGGFFNVMGRYAVIPETVGMWTGLTYKNGKKIFEGDIVKVKNCETFVIKYRHNEFRFIPICNAYTFLQAHEYKESDFEVIGNIYDNKELLEVVNENTK